MTLPSWGSPHADHTFHTILPSMQEEDMPSSQPVQVAPVLGGGIGVGAWGPPDVDEGMDLDSVIAGEVGRGLEE